MHSSKLEGGGHMNENAIRGAPKKVENGELANSATQELSGAPNSKVEDA